MNVAFFLRPKFNVTYIYENDSIRAGLEKMKYHGYTAIPVINDKTTIDAVKNPGLINIPVVLYEK